MDPTPALDALDPDAYDAYITHMRKTEYPALIAEANDAIYLDHAGTALPSISLLRRFNDDMIAILYGNPHSASPSSQASTQMVQQVRCEALRWCNADPEDFDLVFTANATAGIKVVGEALRELTAGFEFAYHVDSHTSLVGLREIASGHRCLETGDDVQTWIADLESREVGPDGPVSLLAYPLQSNMNGRRLPLEWCRRVNAASHPGRAYSLLDAAAYASTSPLDLSDVDAAPDFVVLSFYKIFGFPDLGALLVKKSVAHLFSHRRYFGGGTVDMIVCRDEEWHVNKAGPLHERLEDGTLPIHSILALKSAMRTHQDLFGTLRRVSEHAASLAKQLHERLMALKHANGRSVCADYKATGSEYSDSSTQGPVVAFNMVDGKCDWVSNAEVEKLAGIKNVHLRTGGVCNPGGVATALKLAAWEMRENLSAGHRCGSENDILNGKPTGVIRISLGAMSTRSDVDRFIAFVQEFFVDKTIPTSTMVEDNIDVFEVSSRLHIESLTIYPIKSCGGWQIEHGKPWEVRAEGLAWDREWCIVHQGTGKALSQKQHPRMALLRPTLDLKEGKLRVAVLHDRTEFIEIPLSRNPHHFLSSVRNCTATVCDDDIQTWTYTSPVIAAFFTRAIGVPCTLARFNPASGISRHSKAHLQPPRRDSQITSQRQQRNLDSPPIYLSNESPILTISRSSLNRLNEQIKHAGGKAAPPSVFRPNIVLAESPLLAPGQEQPWAEDFWTHMRVVNGSRATDGGVGPTFDFLAACRRCQMVCVDQESAEKNAEPFVTLAKTRRVKGRVVFGVHTALSVEERDARRDVGKAVYVRAGDGVEVFVD